jgi:hypothetical protein
MPESEPGTPGTETSRLSLDVDESQLDSVAIFDNIVEPAEDEEMVDDSRSDAEGEPIVDEGALSRTKKSTSKKRANIDIQDEADALKAADSNKRQRNQMKKQNADSHGEAIEKILGKPGLRAELAEKRTDVRVAAKERKEAKNAATVKKQTSAKAQFQQLRQTATRSTTTISGKGSNKTTAARVSAREQAQSVPEAVAPKKKGKGAKGGK